MSELAVISFGVCSLATLLLPLRWVLGLIAATTFTPILLFEIDLNSFLLAILITRVLFTDMGARDILSSKFLGTYFLFVVWGLVTLIWAENLSNSIDVLRSYLRVLMGLSVVVAIVKSPDDLIGAIVGYTVGILYCGIMFLFHELGWESSTIQYERTTRLTLAGADPNAIALQVVWGFALISAFAQPVLKLTKTTYFSSMAILFAFCFLVIVTTGSRAALLGLFVTPPLLFLKVAPRLMGSIIGVILTAFVIESIMFPLGRGGMVQTGISLPFASDDTNTRVQSTLAGQDDTGRMFIWGTGLLIAANNPILGVGLGNGKEYYPRYCWLVWRDPYFPTKRTLHNSFITIFAETGIVGFTIFMWFLWSWLKPLLKKGRKTKRIVGTAFIVLVFTTGMTHSFETLTALMLCLAIVYQTRDFGSNLDLAKPRISPRVGKHLHRKVRFAS